MRAGDETATFRADDVDCHLLATLACGACLSGEVRWRLARSRYDPRADCRCERCGFERTVFLRPDQALRLALHEGRPLDPALRPADSYALL